MLTTSSRACVLSTNSDSPPVPQTAVSTDLLHSFNIVTQLGGNALCKDLGVLSSLPVLLSVQEPKRNLELTGILNNSDQLLNLIGTQFTGALVDIDLGLLTDEVSESATKTLDFCKSKDHIALSLNVGVQNTKNVLKFSSLHQ